MKKYIFLTLIVLTLVCTIQAQKNKHSLKFNSINSIGLLSGEIQNKFTFQTINGLQYQGWFAGLGAGLDNYGYRNIPAFMDIRKTFGYNQWQPFVYIDGGINFPLHSSDLQKEWAGIYKVQNTFYGEAGSGVNKNLNKRLQFNFSIGYSYKHLSYLQYNMSYYGIIYNYQPSPTSTQYDFYYRRIAIKTGLQLQF
jgi:hypothetical protein